MHPYLPDFKAPLKTTKSTINSPTKATTMTPTKTLPQIKLSLSKRKAFKIKPFSFKREERRVKIPNEKNKHINVPSTSKVNTPSQDFSFNENETPEDLRRREQAHKYALDPERSNFQIKIFSFNEKETSDGLR